MAAYGGNAGAGLDGEFDSPPSPRALRYLRQFLRPDLDPEDVDAGRQQMLIIGRPSRVECSQFATNCGSPLTWRVLIALGIFYIFALGRRVQTRVMST